MTLEEQLQLALEHIELLKFKITILEAQSSWLPTVDPNTSGAPQDYPGSIICHDHPSSIQTTYNDGPGSATSHDYPDAPDPNYPAPQSPPEGWRP